MLQLMSMSWSEVVTALEESPLNEDRWLDQAYEDRTDTGDDHLLEPDQWYEDDDDGKEPDDEDDWDDWHDWIMGE